ncbi:MAG: hypothetical protein AAGC56_11740 [Pseudomonadota bacterium]
MKALNILAAAVSLTVAATGAALAQDYNDWSTISPYGLEMVDPYGNIYYVDPYAADSQVDVYGNVISSYNTPLDAPAAGWYDLEPSNSSTSYYNTNPYAGATDSHSKFLEMIWE